MLNMKSELLYRSFSFRFIKGPEYTPYQVDSFGWQKVDTKSYSWVGLNRREESGNFIFQYTLSGEGIIIINGKKHKLKRGCAFFVEIPSDHHYFLSDTSKSWEFIFITIRGSEVFKYWNEIKRIYGQTTKIPLDSSVISFFWNIYWDAINEKISDGYHSSVLAYQFLMELVKYQFLGAHDPEDKNNDKMRKIIEYLEKNYHRPISLDDVAQELGQSKFLLSRFFSRTTGINIWEHLTKLRLEKAIQLLQTNNYTIEEISILVGYSCANYFSKVFKNVVGISPSKFRAEYKASDMKVTL